MESMDEINREDLQGLSVYRGQVFYMLYYGVGPVIQFCTVGGEIPPFCFGSFSYHSEKVVVKSHTIICFLGLGENTCGGKTFLA